MDAHLTPGRLLFCLINVLLISACSSKDNPEENRPITVIDEPQSIIDINTPTLAAFDDYSIARQWNEVLLFAIRNDFARPTVHARNLFHLSAAMYDTWAMFQGDNRVRSYLGDSTDCEMPTTSSTDANLMQVSIGFTAHYLIDYRFRQSPRVDETKALAESVLNKTQAAFTEVTFSEAENIGRQIADCYILSFNKDGANESQDYANRSYQSINPAFNPNIPGNSNIIDLNSWQAISLNQSIDQSGNIIEQTPKFLSPEWGNVTPFALSEDLSNLQMLTMENPHI